MSAASRRHVALRAAAIVTIVTACTPLVAHEVVIEQIVTMTFAAEANRLDVRVNVPASLLNDAGLARMDDGRIDPAIDPRALQAVAADVARNLDVRKAGAALPVETAGAQLGADGQSVNVNVAYAFAGPGTGLSARLNAFQGTALRPPRTEVTYLRSPDRRQHLTVTGKPARVSFDPGAAEAFRGSAGSALDRVLNGAGDHLLFLICLVLPMRRPRESARLVGILLAAQAAGIAVSPILAGMGVPLIAPQLVASSAVLVAALAAIVGATPRTLAGLSILFGLTNGVDFGAAFGLVRQFAGFHVSLALMTFTLTTLGVESWLAAVILATRRWLDHVTAAGGILAVVIAALVAHVAMHRVLDRGHALEQTGTFVPDHALMLLALAWTVAMMAVAIARLARERASNNRRTAGAGS